MDNLIIDIHNSILKKWNTSKSIPASELPDRDEIDLSKLIVHYNSAWFVALINPEDEIVVLTFAKVNTAADLPHLLSIGLVFKWL